MLKTYVKYLVVFLLPFAGMFTGNQILSATQTDANTGKLSVHLEDTDGFGIRDAEFTVYGTDNQKVTSFMTDENGNGLSQSIALGEYSIRQTKVAEGFYENATVYNVNVTENGQQVDINGGSTIVNQKKQIDEKGKITGKVINEDGYGIQNAEFTVYDVNNRKVTSMKSDENGNFLSGEIPVGSYTIRETQVASGYVINKTFYYADITSDGDVITINNNQDIVNYKMETDQSGTLTVSVVDKDGNALAGANFTIYDKNGLPVFTITTNDSGVATSEKLELGDYTIRETESPNGYIENKSFYYATISNDGDKIDINNGTPIINYPVSTDSTDNQTTSSNDDQATTSNENQTTEDSTSENATSNDDQAVANESDKSSEENGDSNSSSAEQSNNEQTPKNNSSSEDSTSEEGFIQKIETAINNFMTSIIEMLKSIF